MDQLDYSQFDHRTVLLARGTSSGLRALIPVISLTVKVAMVVDLRATGTQTIEHDAPKRRRAVLVEHEFRLLPFD